MAVKRNKLIPFLGTVVILITCVIVYKRFSAPLRDEAGALMKNVPQSLPVPKGADHDNSTETLKTVVAGNNALRDDIQKVLRANEDLRAENERLQRFGPNSAGANSTSTKAPATGGAVSAGTGTGSAGTEISVGDVFDRALNTASGTLNGIARAAPSDGAFNAASARASRASLPSMPRTDSQADATVERPGAISYKVLPPMGYATQTTQGGSGAGLRGTAMTRYVRTTAPESESAATVTVDDAGPASRAAFAAAAGQGGGQGDGKGEDVPYFTIPENATLAGVTAMSSIIGRVPIDGRVTDPMQFKAIVGRDNLAANGWELPDDLAGMILTGIAIGDMALSCSEGKVRSMTFIFNDGSVRTVSTRRGNTGNGASSGGAAADLGFISDEHGNPCIAGKFVTNAASYLTDIVGAKSLGVAAQAYAEAQRTTSSTTAGTFTSAVTGNAGSYALGSAAAGATDELTKWLLQRLKNSFDAVVTPSGQRLVVHLDQEIRIDKTASARKLVYRNQGGTAQGERHGLD